MAGLVIVTAASSNHYQSLRQFLGTVRQYEPQARSVVYDLGLEAWQHSELATASGIEVRRFDYARYPAYFDITIAAGHYAWKPAIIKEVADSHKGIILWCDAGNKILHPLDELRVFVEKSKIYSPLSSGSVRQWTHPACLASFGITPDHPIMEMPPRNGAILAFDNRDADVAKFIDEFYRLACTRTCIAPEGSNRANHRQDQAVFTILYYAFAASHKLPMESGYLGLSIHNDVD